MIRRQPQLLRIIHDERHNEPYIPSEIQREIDAHDRLVEDIRGYVADCVERGVEPDGYAFCIEHRIDYGDVPGTIVEELITKEMKRNGND